MAFNDLRRSLLTARGATKKLSNNTYARVTLGTRAEPGIIAVRYHSTDILLFHADGAIDVSTYSLCSSMTTKQRLSALANVHITSRPLAAINGYRPYEDTALFLCTGTGDWRTREFVAWNGRKGDYIRVNPDKTIDMSTVAPHKVTCIAKPKEMRRAMRKVSTIVRTALVFAKLSGNNSAFAKPDNVYTWVIQQYKKPLDELDLTALPYIHPSADPKVAFAQVMNEVRWTIAKWEGYTEEREVLYG